MENYQSSFRAIGSDIVLTVVSDDPAQAKVVFDELRAYIEDFEQRFSRFRPSSELSRINATAGQRTEASREFVALLKTAVSLSEATDGLFNPFILPKLQEAGYKGSWPTSHEQGEAPQYQERKVATVDMVLCGADWVRIPAATALDFGGIGKGYLLDRLAALVPNELPGYWFSLGGDILMAGRDATDEAWEVGVAHALIEDKQVGSFNNERGWSLAVATSGVTKRRGTNEGKDWHHIIDPRTGEPAETDLLTVTVCCEDPTEADILAKSALILGSKAAWPFLDRHKVRGAILQRMGDNEEVIIIHSGDDL
jgi:thiamine biosynthesis lipoprotein